jgi:hypothetical protein
MAKKAKKTTALPTTIYVVRDNDGYDTWLNIHEDIDGIEDLAVVGVYERVDVRTARVTKELV